MAVTGPYDATLVLIISILSLVLGFMLGYWYASRA